MSEAVIPPAATTLEVVTRETAPPSSLIPLADPAHPLLVVRRGDGIVGIGEALRAEFTGPDRIREASAFWREMVARATVDDPVQRSGTGLVAFGAFAFADESAARSVLVVPRIVVGRRDGAGWITRIDGAEETVRATGFGPEYRVSLHPGRLGPDGYRDAVRAAVERIRSSASEKPVLEKAVLEKVVLARDLTTHLPREADLRRALVHLALGYPDTWTYAVDGLVGSSPETLVRVSHGSVTARVLAGSAARGTDAESDQAAALALATSTKDLDEHRYAVQSVRGALRPHTRGLASSELPYTLKLPNLWHLASDIEGTLVDGSTALDLVAELHPTAAVAGTPRDAALMAIRELEPFDRRRYAGPVGWVDGSGDGKWAIALRSAEVDDDGTVTAYAGAGIVADSDPEHELAETALKFRPVKEALA